MGLGCIANLNSVPFEGFMANGFAAGGQRTATQCLRFGTRIITETISRVDLSHCPFRYWREGQEEEDEESDTADTVIVATSASAKESGMSACAVCDGLNRPLAVIGGGGDSATEEATSKLTKYGAHIYVLVHRDKLRALDIMAKPLVDNPKISILWDTRWKNLWTRNVQTGSEKDLDVNRLFHDLSIHEPATAIFRTQIQTDPNGYIINTSVRGVFAAVDVRDKRYSQAITSVGSGCIAVLEAERLIVESQEKEMMGE
ncbi:hypothetical protein K435DRAFT_822809 [Dendrothele bispora CBS 962.96]|uniref:FAD/NAD(P)-binding domain-containing protein n=1 Tax=Dendrothele bispora (strain CBS 962.96) TaxID=1314807 RepID=A0A4V4HCN5_DENBC|nr:hypothetical protein K435DRAFT_822809 [Dendrothele bispora CBS 962.96]